MQGLKRSSFSYYKSKNISLPLCTLLGKCPNYFFFNTLFVVIFWTVEQQIPLAEHAAWMMQLCDWFMSEIAKPILIFCNSSKWPIPWFYLSVVEVRLIQTVNGECLFVQDLFFKEGHFEKWTKISAQSNLSMSGYLLLYNISLVLSKKSRRQSPIL